MNYMEGGEWLDGPKLCEWIDPKVPPSSGGGQGANSWVETFVRRMYEWRKGLPVNFYTLDTYLCHMGITPWEIPEECWLETRPGSTVCRNGHERTEDNTKRTKGKVICVECRRERQRNRHKNKTPLYIDAEPFARLLRERHKELGTWAAVGVEYGMERTAAHRYAKPYRPKVQRQRMERLLGNDFQKVYPEECREAVA